MHFISSHDKLSYKGSFSDGIHYKIYSDINRQAVPVMNINGERVYFSGYGLNILVYDRYNLNPHAPLLAPP